ncbi:MAG: hypothetical protein ACXAEU_08180 [Candidatus Hodarchaeales archaeon]
MSHVSIRARGYQFKERKERGLAETYSKMEEDLGNIRKHHYCLIFQKGSLSD